MRNQFKNEKSLFKLIFIKKNVIHFSNLIKPSKKTTKKCYDPYPTLSLGGPATQPLTTRCEAPNYRLFHIKHPYWLHNPH